MARDLAFKVRLMVQRSAAVSAVEGGNPLEREDPSRQPVHAPNPKTTEARRR
jgi:hypothetical protein